MFPTLVCHGAFSTSYLSSFTKKSPSLSISLWTYVLECSKLGSTLKMSLLFYRRPDYVRNTGPMDSSDYQKHIEKTRRAIPPELCFDNVVANRAMPVRANDIYTEPQLTLPAMLSPRLHGLPDERLSWRRKPTILSLASGLQTPLLRFIRPWASFIPTVGWRCNTSAIWDRSAVWNYLGQKHGLPHQFRQQGHTSLTYVR